MSRGNFIFAIFVLSISAWAQQITAPMAVDGKGNPYPQQVTVCTTNPGRGSCATQATLYTDSTLSTACSGTAVQLNGTNCSNPGFADNDGNVIAYTVPGNYWCQYSGVGIVPYSRPCPTTGGGAFAGVPNVVTVPGSTTTYPIGSTDLCKAMANAINANLNGVVLDARGATGNQVCSSANLTSLNTALNAASGPIQIFLGCPVVWYLPLQSFAAAVPATNGNSTPLVGALTLSPADSIIGCSTASVASNFASRIAACAGTNYPVSGCTAPQQHEFAITSTTITTGTTNHRSYMLVNVSGTNDIVGGQPIHINGCAATGCSTANNLIVGAYRVCQTNATANYTSNVTVDGDCPSAPTASAFYVPVNSGIISATAAGNGSGYSAATIVTFTGGACTNEPTGTVTVVGGVPTAINVTSYGRGCTSAPTATISDTGGGTGASNPTVVMASSMACGATCGSTVHAALPLIDFVTNGSPYVGVATMSTGLYHVTIDCQELPDCVGMRSTGANEHTHVEDINFTGQIERGIEYWMKSTNSGDTIKSVRFLPGNLPGNPVPSTQVTTVNTSGTTITGTSGAAFDNAWVSSASKPIVYINGVAALVGTVSSATSMTVTTGQGTQTGVTMNVWGCDAGTESVFIGDGGPHGIQDFTADYSGCLPLAGSYSGTVNTQNAATGGCTANCVTKTAGQNFDFIWASATCPTAITIGASTFQVTSVQSTTVLTLATAPGTQTGVAYSVSQQQGTNQCNQVPTTAIRYDANNWSTKIFEGHGEKLWSTVLCGTGQACRYLNVDSVWGSPGAFTNLNASQFQTALPPVLKIRSDFSGTSGTNTQTTHITAQNISTNTGSTYGVCDDLPDGIATTPGPCQLDQATGFFATDLNLQNNGSVCQNTQTTTSWGSNLGCINNGYQATTSTCQVASAGQAISGTSAATSNPFCTMGGWTPNTKYRVHCTGTFTQAVTANGIGLAYYTTGTAQSVELHGKIFPTASTFIQASTGTSSVLNTGTNIVGPTGAPTAATPLPFEIDGTMSVGATPPNNLIIAAYIVSGSGTTTINQYASCGAIP